MDFVLPITNVAGQIRSLSLGLPHFLILCVRRQAMKTKKTQQAEAVEETKEAVTKRAQQAEVVEETKEAVSFSTPPTPPEIVDMETTPTTTPILSAPAALPVVTTTKRVRPFYVMLACVGVAWWIIFIYYLCFVPLIEEEV